MLLVFVLGTMSLLAPLDLLVLGTHCRSLRRGEAGGGGGGSGRRREGRGGWKRDGGVGEGMGVGSRYFFHYNQFFGSVRDAFFSFLFLLQPVVLSSSVTVVPGTATQHLTYIYR